MIRINNIKLKPGYTKGDLEAEIKRQLKLKTVPEYRISKLSIDDRKRNDVKIVISCDILNVNEKSILKRVNNKNIMSTTLVKYNPQVTGEKIIKAPPVVVGMGPSGLFAALMLARLGFKPIVFERGMDVDSRTKCVNDFWNGDTPINPESNVLFGEGGAGTFSDGKLNSVIKDKSGRRTFVLKTFVEYGADPEILISNKPHIGTDVLAKVVKNMRQDIIRLGGQVNFSSKLTDFAVNDDGTLNISILKDGQVTTYNTEVLILAIGHSARDTFKLLYDRGLKVEQKPFAMGVRIEHKREFINRGKYGDKPEYEKLLPTADYKFAHSCENGRSVYSFCMCPGGYVVNSSSEPGRLCVNGMSYSDRMADNSNSAVVVNVTPEDFGSDHPLAGMYMQEHYEEMAYKAGNGDIPVTTFKGFKTDEKISHLGDIQPCIKGKYRLASLKDCLPKYIKNAIIEGVLAFDRYMPGYACDDAVISGIEARTSSPVRITRNEEMTSYHGLIYPCGEGAGYAGGITSAAVDGIKAAEAVISRYKNTQE